MKTIKVIDDKTIEVDGKRYVEVPEPQTEFKVGQWLMIQHMGHICAIHSDGFKWAGFKAGQHPDKTQPVRLIEKRKMNYPDMHIVEQSGNVFLFAYKEAFRLATPAEIEAHLKEEAERRGYKPGVRIKYMLQGGLSDIHERIITIRDIDFRYDSLEDELCLYSCGNFSARLYSQGKWAEILPDKKKLPKTKEGYKDFSKDCINFYFNHNADKGNPDWIEKFISQYED